MKGHPMDPHVAYTILTNAVTEWQTDESYDIADRLDTVMEAFRALDEWLSAGGFLPAAWERTPHVSS